MATPHSASDQELVTRWTQGDDPSAGAELFRRHYEPLLRFYRSKVGPPAPDLVQRCFLRCIEIRARIRADSSFRGMLFGVARNVLLEHYRRARTTANVDFGSHTVADLSPTPTSELAHQESSRLLLRALQQLPVDQQIVVELYYWDELNAREIAEVFEIPEATVRTRLRRAKLRLEQLLRELASTPMLAEQTLSSLDSWARRLRDQLGESTPS